MNSNTLDVMGLIESIKAIPCESQIITTAKECIKALGADYFVYTSFLGDSDDPVLESRRFFIGCLPAWCQMYNQRKWFETDPFVIYSRSFNTAPICGSEVTVQSAGQKEMLEAAARNGFKSCMVIPVHTGNIKHMGMLYVGNAEDPAVGEQTLKRNRGYYRLLAAEMLDWWIVRVREEAIATYQLDQKEVMVLKLVLEGLVAKEKAEEMGVSVRTIYAIYQRIKDKFLVDDVRDAAKIAHARGILNFVGVPA